MTIILVLLIKGSEAPTLPLEKSDLDILRYFKSKLKMMRIPKLVPSPWSDAHGPQWLSVQGTNRRINQKREGK